MTTVSFQALTLALTMFMSSAIAQAQTSAAPQSPNTPDVEVTPFVSMGSLRSSRIGNAVSFPVSSSLSVEAEVGYRRGEGRIDALSAHVSLLYSLPRIGRVAPYLAAGVGLEEYGSPFVMPGSSEIFTRSALAFAINAGGGITVPVDQQWGLRTDARWFNPLGRGSSEHWRLYQGASFGVGK